jgi:hypothetical protein
MVTSVIRTASEIILHCLEKGSIELIRIGEVLETNQEFGHDHNASPVGEEVDRGTDMMESLAEVDGDGIDHQVTMETSGRETKDEAHDRQRRKTKIGSEITCCYTFLRRTV